MCCCIEGSEEVIPGETSQSISTEAVADSSVWEGVGGLQTHKLSYVSFWTVLPHTGSFRANPLLKRNLFLSHLYSDLDQQTRRLSRLYIHLANPCQSSPLTNAITGQERLLLANKLTKADGKMRNSQSPNLLLYLRVPEVHGLFWEVLTL